MRHPSKWATRQDHYSSVRAPCSSCIVAIRNFVSWRIANTNGGDATPFCFIVEYSEPSNKFSQPWDFVWPISYFASFSLIHLFACVNSEKALSFAILLHQYSKDGMSFSPSSLSRIESYPMESGTVNEWHKMSNTGPKESEFCQRPLSHTFPLPY